MLSSMEAEYVALSEAGHEATWLRNLYGELGFPQTNPTIIKGENDGSVVLTHNPQFHQQSKHITLCHHWVQDLVTNKILDIQNCHNPERTVDIIMNALLRPKFTWHRGEMGIQLIQSDFSTTQRFWCTWTTIQLTIPNNSNHAWLEGECWDRQSKPVVLIIEWLLWLVCYL